MRCVMALLLLPNAKLSQRLPLLAKTQECPQGSGQRQGIWRSACVQGACIMANKQRRWYEGPVDEGRTRVIGIMAAILATLHMRNADDLFGGPPGSPRADKPI